MKEKFFDWDGQPFDDLYVQICKIALVKLIPYQMFFIFSYTFKTKTKYPISISLKVRNRYFAPWIISNLSH